MKFRLKKRSKRSPIGIDVGRRCLHAVQLETSATGGWRVSAAATLPRAVALASADPAPSLPSAAEVRQLADVLHRQGFSGDQIVLAATDQLVTSILELPPMANQAPVEQISRMELARTHRCAPDSFELGVWDLPAPARAQKATHVMAAAMPHADADALLDVFENAGFDVCAMDMRHDAVARACGTAANDSATAAHSITAVLDLGWCAGELSLMYRGALIYVRLLPEAGLRHLREQFVAKLRIEPDIADFTIFHEEESAGEDASQEARALLAGYADSAAQELLASFSYAVHQYPDAAVDRMLLVGGGGAIPKLAAHFETILGIDVRSIAPAGLLECAPEIAEACASPALIASLGLAQFPEF